MVISLVLGLVPAVCRLTSASSSAVAGDGVPFLPTTNSSTPYSLSAAEMTQYALEHVTTMTVAILNIAFGETLWSVSCQTTRSQFLLSRNFPKNDVLFKRHCQFEV